MEKIVLKEITHKEEKRILLTFPYNKGDSYDIAVRKLPGRLWSKTYGKWHIPLTVDYYKHVSQYFGGLDCEIADLVYDDKNSNPQREQKIEMKPKSEGKPLDSAKTIVIGIKKEFIPLVKYYTDSLRLKNYSPNTIDAYVPFFKQFVIHFGENEIDNLSIKQLHEYVKNIIEKQKLTEVPTKHIISAIKFYYEKIRGREKIYFPLQKKYEIIPIELKIKIEELIPFINVMKKPYEKLLILLKFHFGYSTKDIINKTIEEVTKFLQNISAKKTDTYNILYETLKCYLEKTNPKTYLFEKETGKQIQEDELDRHIFSIVSKYKIGIVYKYEINNAMEQLNFKETTRKSYIGCYLSFLRHYNFRHPSLITDEEIRNFLVKIRILKENSSSYLNLTISAINFYYTHILKRKLNTGTIIRPKKEKILPEVICQDEIIGLIEKTKNIKHKLVLSLLYSLGLRRQELIDLKTSDIDFQRNVIIVKQGKGKKDRQIPIPRNLKEQIISYLPEYKPEKYLIEGNKHGKYSGTSVINIVKDAAKRAGITKNVYPHILRHSIATHMLEEGTDITFIREFLGHNDLKTTMRYTHVSNKTAQKIRNPFDNIKFQVPL
ncbi:MAG: tyrosine-type recombinase/integrase [Bacteroidales bacterium]|nr:tyrosine-type recombinase/integrase [Bacteroidales bacterium]